MPSIILPAMQADLTGNGDNAGYVTVASNAGWYPGQTVNLWSSAAGSLECVITDLSGTTKIGLRAKPQTARTGSGPNYGRSDVSAWLVADSARLFAETQVVPVRDANSNKISLL